MEFANHYTLQRDNFLAIDVALSHSLEVHNLNGSIESSKAY